MGAIHATMNISLDGCCEHTQVVADDDFHDKMADLFGPMAGLLFGRKTYDLLHGYWPHVAATGNGTRAVVRLARVLAEKPKYVVSSRVLSDEWNARQVDGSVDDVRALKTDSTGTLLLVASPSLARTLVHEGLVDEYHLAISPMLAGHGPRFLDGLSPPPSMRLLEMDRLPSGVVIHRYSLSPAPVDRP